MLGLDSKVYSVDPCLLSEGWQSQAFVFAIALDKTKRARPYEV